MPASRTVPGGCCPAGTASLAAIPRERHLLGLPLSHADGTQGLTFSAAVTVLGELCASPALAGLVLTEVNPTRDPGGELLGRYVDGVTAALAEAARAR